MWSGPPKPGPDELGLSFRVERGRPRNVILGAWFTRARYGVTTGIASRGAPVSVGMYTGKRNWKKLIAIYAAVAVVVYGVIYLLFFSGLFSGGGGGGASPYG